MVGVVLAVGALSGARGAFAAAAPGTATWEPGSPTAFEDLECPHPRRQLRVVSAPVREGTRAVRVSVGPDDVWSNGTVRCLMASYSAGEMAGDDVTFSFSLLIPERGISEVLIWELHQPQSLYDLPGCGLAPFAIFSDGRGLLFRIATGDCRSGKGMSFFEPNIAIPRLVPYPRGVWIDLRIRIRFAEAPTGRVELWSRTAGHSWPRQPSVTRSGIPTMPFSSAEGVNGVALYDELGLYPATQPYAGRDTVFLDAYRRTITTGGGGETPWIVAAAIAALALSAAAWIGIQRFRRPTSPRG